MRKSGLVVVVPIVVIALLFVAGRWLWKEGDSPTLVSNAPTAGATGTEQPGSATSTIDAPAARVAETTAVAPPRNGRFGARGTVRFASDARPAAGARVRAFADVPPLMRMQLGERMKEAGGKRKPAAVHDLGGGPVADEEPAPDADAASDAKPEKTHDHAKRDDADRDRKDAPLAETIADAAGHFELLGLEPSKFQLDAIAPLAVAEAPVVVELGEATIREDVELLLVGGAELHGRVLTPDRRPIADAVVTASVPFDPYSVFAAGGFDLRAPASVRTQADGTFRFEALPAPIDLRVRARAKDFADSPIASIAIPLGASRELELTVPTGAAIVLHVLDEHGAPAAGVACRCQPASIRLDTLGFDAEGMKTSAIDSDAAGVARFDGLTAGKWRLTADAKGKALVAKAVEVAAGATLDVELRVDPGKELRGTVHAKDGTPIAGARLSASLEPSFMNLAAMADRSSARKATSGEDGSFVLGGLPAEKLLLEARATGYQPANVKTVAGGEPVDVVLATRGALEGIVVSRKTMKPVTRFDVKLARKKETSGFLAFSPSAAESLVDLTLPFETPNGKFRIVGVNPGSLRLTVRAAGHGEQATEWIDLAEGETHRGLLVYLEPEAVIEGQVVDAATGAPLPDAEIRRDTGGGNALDNMMSQIFTGSDAHTDKEGRFRIDGLTAGAHRLVASHAGYVETSPPEIVVAAGQTDSSVRIALDKGGEIYGHVSGPNGAPIASASVFCQDVTRFKMNSVKSDAHGDYRIQGLAGGSYSVTKLPESFDLSNEAMLADITSKLETQTIRLKAGESLRVDFAGAAQGHATLEGTVKQAGKAVASAMVSVFVQGEGAAAGSSAMKTASTKSDGSYRVESLLAGPAFVQVNQGDMGFDGGLSAMVAMATLRDDETTHLDLEIPAGSITGTVVDAQSGATLPGIAVYTASSETSGQTGESMLELAMRRATTVRTDEHGAFRLKNLRGGVHRIVAGGSDLMASGSTSHALVSRDGVAVPDGGTVDVGELRLPAAARIEGTVTDAGGAPLSGASVFLRDPGTGAYLEEWTGTSSNDSGHFEYGGVPSGTWDVVCRAPGHATAVARSVAAHEGAVATVRVKLIGGTEVFADVGDVDLQKLVDLRIEVEGPDGRIPLTLFGLGDLTDLLQRPWRSDIVRLGRFGPGDYRVTGRLGEKSFEKKFTLAGEAEMHIPVSLP